MSGATQFGNVQFWLTWAIHFTWLFSWKANLSSKSVKKKVSVLLHVSYSFFLLRFLHFLLHSWLHCCFSPSGCQLPILRIIVSDTAELPVASPLIYACLRATESWRDSALECVDAFTQVPDNFIPGCFANSMATGPAIEKYRGLFELHNTPFR